MALTANRKVSEFVGDNYKFEDFPVLAAAHIYQGGFVGLTPSGYAKAFVPGDKLIGVAYEEKDNTSGASAALYCRVITSGFDYEHAITSVAITDVGRQVFATADNTLAFTGHPDAFAGRVVSYTRSGYARVRMREWGEEPISGEGCLILKLEGNESFTATGATAGTACVGAWDMKSILGPGFLMYDAEDSDIQLAFDNTAEVALASVRTRNDCLPVDKGLTFECDLVVSDKGDSNTLDIDFGFGTALTTNSEADMDHTDMAQLACFHLDGNSDNILAQSDDATTDVTATDTTIDNDSTTDVKLKFQIIVRPTGSVEFWISKARVLSTTTFALLSTALVSAFVNMEKTSNDTTAEILFRNLVVKAGKASL